MTKTLPTGYIGLDDAVEMIVRHKYPGPGIILRDDGEEAFRELCQLVPEGRVTPQMLDERGFVREADRKQFFGFKDKYWKFASALLYYPRDDHDRRVADEDDWKKVAGEIEREPSYDLLDDRGQLHRNATLIFGESVEGELASVSEPTGDSPEVATWPETPSFDEVYEADKSPVPVGSCGEHIEESLRAEHVADEPEATGGDEAHDDIEAECRPVLASVTDDKIADFLKTAGCTNMNAAWALVKAKFPGVTQKRFRSIWKRNYFGGARGRRANCVA
jgi:hypothetical protein